METWESLEPTPVAEVNPLDVGQLRRGLSNRKHLLDYRVELYEEDLPGINNELGLDDLPIKPDSFRIYRSSKRRDTVWHIDAVRGHIKSGNIPRIAVFASSDPTEVCVGLLPFSENGRWEDAIVEEAIRADMLERFTLEPNIYYLLDRTVHRMLRLFGRWTQASSLERTH